MDCIKQTGTGVPVQQSSATAVPINSQALGFTGPVSVGLRYDNYLAWILDVGYAQSFYNAAAAFKLSAGLNERRANVTLGYSITPKQQIKLTYEYLAQNLPFDYASGTVNEWVNQNAMGGAYRYLLDNGIVRALEVYGNYTKANSKELNEVEMYTDNVLTQIDYRRIAGGTQQNAGAAVTLTPAKGTIIKVGAGYSSLSFDTKWEDNEANAVLAYNAEVSQLLTPTVLVSGGIGNTASGSTYTAKVSKILPWSLEASLIGQYMSATNDMPGGTSVTAGLSYPAPKTYTNMFSEGVGNLKEWVQQPVIYNTRVLAKAEEKLVKVQITKKADIPDQNVPVNLSLTPPLETKDYFAFDPAAYDKVAYKFDSIVNKVDQKPIDPSLNNLNLGIKNLDSYNAEIISSSPTTQAMMPTGQNVTYTVNLLAQGSRGPVISTLSIPFDITVAVNNQTLKPANWVDNPPPLPNAVPNSTYNQTIILNDPKYLTPNFKGEDFTFDLVGPNNPNWVTLTADRKSLIGDTKNPVPSTTDKQATVTLKATSLASGFVATPETGKALTIPITSSATPPTWATATLPQATQGNVYTPSGTTTGYDLNPYSPTPTGLTNPDLINGQLIKPTPSSDTVTFKMHSPLDSDDCQDWLKIVNGRYLISNGPVPDNVQEAGCLVNVDVTSTNIPNNPTQMLPKPKITVIKPVIANWNTDSKYATLPPANVGTTYSLGTQVLDPYPTNASGYITQTTINGNVVYPPDEVITFQINPQANLKASPCLWLKVTDDGKSIYSTDKVSTVSGTDSCNAYLDIISKVNNYVPQPLAAKLIPIASSAPFQPFWTDAKYGPTVDAPYNDPNNIVVNNFSMDLTKAINSNLSSDQLSFTKGNPWDCKWLDINTNGILAGTTPTTLSDDCSITISVTSTISPGNSPQPLTDTVHFIPNKNIPFKPYITKTPPPPVFNPAVYGIAYNSQEPIPIASNRVGETLKTPFTLPTNSCPTVDFKVNDSNQLYTSNQVTLSNQTCNLTFNVISNFDSSTADVPTTIDLVPDTSGDFKPHFTTGNPPPGMYNQNQNYTQPLPLNQIIVSNRSGGQEPLKDFAINTSAWTCGWLTIDGNNLVQTRTPNVKDDTATCHVSVSVASATNGDPGTADADVTVGPDTTIGFQPYFIDGQPPIAYYNTNYPTNDLTTMIVSNRAGEQLKPTFTASTPWSCSWLTLQSDGKTLSSNTPPQATTPYTGDTTCTITVSATSANVTGQLPANVTGTVTIKPDMTLPFAPTGTLPNAIYGTGPSLYNQNLTQLVQSNRPGEPLAPPFTIDTAGTTCTNSSGTPWLTIDSGNNLKNTIPVPVKKGLTSCIVSLNVSSGYSGATTEPTKVPLTITFDKNSAMTPQWVTSAQCPATIDANIYKSGAPPIEIGNCIKNYINGQPVDDNTMSFSGNNSIANVTNTQINANPTLNDWNKTYPLTINVSSDAYSGSKPVSENLLVHYYVIPGTNQDFPVYTSMATSPPYASRSSAYRGQDLPSGGHYTVEGYNSGITLNQITVCNWVSNTNGNSTGFINPSNGPWDSLNGSAYKTCYITSPLDNGKSGVFILGDDGYFTITFTIGGPGYSPSQPVVSNIKIGKQ